MSGPGNVRPRCGTLTRPGQQAAKSRFRPVRRPPKSDTPCRSRERSASGCAERPPDDRAPGWLPAPGATAAQPARQATRPGCHQGPALAHSPSVDVSRIEANQIEESGSRREQSGGMIEEDQPLIAARTIRRGSSPWTVGQQPRTEGGCGRSDRSSPIHLDWSSALTKTTPIGKFGDLSATRVTSASARLPISIRVIFRATRSSARDRGFPSLTGTTRANRRVILSNDSGVKPRSSPPRRPADGRQRERLVPFHYVNAVLRLTGCGRQRQGLVGSHIKPVQAPARLRVSFDGHEPES